MLKVMITALLVCSAVFLSGCQTVTRNKEEQIRKYSRISDLNRRMLAEDMDAILLLDRPSSLTRWNVRDD